MKREDKELVRYIMLFVSIAIPYFFYWFINIPSDAEIAGFLKKEGYRKVRVGKLAFFSSCDHRDLYTFEFVAERNGKPVNGFVCKGKLATIAKDNLPDCEE